MNASNYYKEKHEVQNQINLLAAFLSFADNQTEFQKIHFEITYLILKLKKFDQAYVKNKNYRFALKFETIQSTINEEYPCIEYY